MVVFYLDNASTTVVDESLRDTINRFLYQDYFNPGSKHRGGNAVSDVLTNARRKVEFALGASEDSVIFTSSGSEANTLAVLGVANHLKSSGKKHILVSKYEHKSVLCAVDKLASDGFDVEYLDVPDGVVNVVDIEQKIRSDTGLVSVMFVNNELGTVNNVKSIHEICDKRDVLFHCDCVQAFGFEPVTADIADFITISGHKIHAPKGVGCLYAKDKLILEGIICGGGQEFGLRPGTENVAYIAAFSEAVERAVLEREKQAKHILDIASVFIGALKEKCEQNNISVSFNANKSELPNKILSIRFDGVDAETLTMMLSDVGIYVSTGSACNKNSIKPSHVLEAIGLSEVESRSTFRVSFSKYDTSQVQIAASVIADSAAFLKSIKLE